MPSEDLNYVVKEGTRNVCFACLATVTVMVLTIYCYVVRLTNLDSNYYFIYRHEPDFIHCLHSFAGEVDNYGKVEFNVLMWNPYHIEKTVVGKISAEKDDNFVLAGDKLVWYGTFDVKGNEFSSPTIYFQNDKTLSNSSRRHHYIVNCPSLNTMLSEERRRWFEDQSSVKSNKSVHFHKKDILFLPQELDKIECYDAFVAPPIGVHGTTEVSVYLKNPYGKNVIINKFPTIGNETLVIRETYVIWYGSYDLESRELFQRTLISFENTLPNGSTRRHYHNLTCPILEKKLKEFTTEWWNKQNLLVSKASYFAVFYCVAFGFAMGLISGECLAKKDLSKRLQLE